MKSVGKAADAMVEECRRQFPIILGKTKQDEKDPAKYPDYAKCIGIATDASLREMIMPGVLVMGSPLIAGFCFGKNCTAGLLSGALVSGVQMAISMSNTGGAWDNAKKYIEASGAKGSEQHKNAVTGDTVGDPLKDTSGPALNILVKLSAIISLVFGGVIAQTSNEVGGPTGSRFPRREHHRRREGPRAQRHRGGNPAAHTIYVNTMFVLPRIWEISRLPLSSH